MLSSKAARTGYEEMSLINVVLSRATSFSSDTSLKITLKLKSQSAVLISFQ